MGNHANYMVKATIRKDCDPATERVVQKFGRNPDILKVDIENDNPGFRIHRVLEIHDLRPYPVRWDLR